MLEIDDKTRQLTRQLSSLGIKTNEDTVDIEESKEWDPLCDCKIYFAGQEMSPRLWRCKRHGRQGFSQITNLIKQISVKRNITYEDAYDLAEQYLKELNSGGRGIYSCEDHFYNDLKKKYFDDNIFVKMINFVKG